MNCMAESNMAENTLQMLSILAGVLYNITLQVLYLRQYLTTTRKQCWGPLQACEIS